MKVKAFDLPGVMLIEPRVLFDTRGVFVECWSAGRYADAGLPTAFVQDNISSSVRGTLRGLHLQHPHGQGKLVQVLVGEIFDVAADVRLGSPSFGQWTGVTLSERNRQQLYIPPGFAHGFCVLSETAMFSYKCTEYYRPETEIVVAWNDPEIGVRWPVELPVLSEKDKTASTLRDLSPRLPRYE